MQPISVITCSVRPKLFQQMLQSLERAMGEDFEPILIRDARSLCEGYQRGLALAHGEILIFCHDDISFLSGSLAARLREDLTRFDLIGVCGTSLLSSGKWVSSGYPHLHGQIAHQPGGMGPFSLARYGCGREGGLVGGIHALDGVFFAARRQVAEQIGFDATTFDGFHLYDLDFSWRAHRAGYKLAIDHAIHLLHYSSGRFDQAWNRYKYLFQKKFKGQLDRLETPGQPFYINQPVSERHTLSQLMLHYQAPQALHCLCNSDGSAKPIDATRPWVSWAELERASNHSLDFLALAYPERLPQAPEAWLEACWRRLRHAAVFELTTTSPEIKDFLNSRVELFLQVTSDYSGVILYQSIKKTVS